MTMEIENTIKAICKHISQNIDRKGCLEPKEISALAELIRAYADMCSLSD